MDDSAEAWTRYWASGALASLGLAGSETESAFADHWRSWFDALPRGALVVDLGSGNGPLVRYALGLDGAGRDPQRVVHAIDAAALAPAWLEALPERREGVVWHPSTRMEATPIAAGTVDAACSQFGFEYGEEAGTIAELGRIARAGARLSLLVHHADSEVLGRGRAEHRGLQRVLEPEGLFDVAAEVAAALIARREGRPADEASRRRYNAVQAALDARIGEAPDEAAAIEDARRAVHVALSAVAGGGAVDGLAEVRKAFEATRRRLADLLGAARDEAAIERMIGRFHAGGWACDAQPFTTSEGLWAWRVEGERLAPR